MIRRIGILFILAACLLASAWAQQPVAQSQPALVQASLTSTTCPGSGCSAVPTLGMGVATVTVHGTYSGATINFLFSDDGGTTYYTEQCTRTDVAVQEISEVLPSNQTRAWDCGVYSTTNFEVKLTAISSGTATVGITTSATPIEPASTVDAVGSLSNNGQAAAANRIPTLPCIAETDPSNGSAATAGNDEAPNCGTEGNLWVSLQPALRPASFVASKSFAGSSTTDNAVLPGNATNTVLVTRVIVSCIQTTAGIITLNVIKRSAADTSGTSASMTAVPDDSTFSAASSAPLSYTGTGPTAGAAVGNVDTYQLGCMAAATASPNDIYILDRRLKPIVLRGTAQQLAVNFGGAITGGNLTVSFEWEEVKTITP